MNEPAAEDRLFRYLLGDALTHAEQNDIEECYFNDDSYFGRVLAAEDELIDRRLGGTLSADEEALFERNFLSSSRRRAKWQARDTKAGLHSRPPAPPISLAVSFRGFLGSLTPPSRVFLAVSSLLVLGCISLLGWRYLDLRRQTSALQSRLEIIERGSADPMDVAEFILEPERFRSGSADPLRISDGVHWVVLRVKLPALYSAYSSFGVTLSTAEGDELLKQNRLAPTASSIEVDLSARALKRGDYVLLLNAVSGRGEIELPSYQFRVDR